MLFISLISQLLICEIPLGAPLSIMHIPLFNGCVDSHRY